MWDTFFGRFLLFLNQILWNSFECLGIRVGILDIDENKSILNFDELVDCEQKTTDQLLIGGRHMYWVD